MEIYVSTDIEADGPIPGPNSMYSFGSYAFDWTGKEYGTFYATLTEIPGAAADQKTKTDFWDKHPDAFAMARKDAEDPALVMPRYRDWLKKLPGPPVFVGYPATYDFMFVYWYLMKYAGESPFAHSALDIKTYACCLMKKPFRQSTKKGMPPVWFPKDPHTHNGLDDAIEQGKLFLAMMAERFGKKGGSVIPAGNIMATPSPITGKTTFAPAPAVVPTQPSTGFQG